MGGGGWVGVPAPSYHPRTPHPVVLWQSDHAMVQWLLSLDSSYLAAVLSSDCDLAFSGALQSKAVALVRKDPVSVCVSLV